MEKIGRQVLLYDFYGELLTDHQKSVYEDVVLNDLSLGEIAEQRGITRQGVHDIVRRCDRILSEYEEKLHLVERFRKTREDVLRIQALTESDAPDGTGPDSGMCADAETMREIHSLSERILEEL